MLKNLLLIGLVLLIGDRGVESSKLPETLEVVQEPTEHGIFKGKKYQVFRFDPQSDSLFSGWLNSSGWPYFYPEAFRAKIDEPVSLIINAGMFHPNHQPVGLYIENGAVLVPVDTSSASGNFYLKPNGIFGVSDSTAWIGTTNQYIQELPPFNTATQSGPMLVIDDKIHPAFREQSTNLRPYRLGVGKQESGLIVFALARESTNLHEFASYFKERFMCKNALYLDGGISFMSVSGFPYDSTHISKHKYGPFLGVIRNK